MRTYKKRTKSTKSKTYKEYLEMRKELAGKGYELKEVLSERQFKENLKLAEIYSMTPAQIHLLGDFINRTKDTGLYGGSYE